MIMTNFVRKYIRRSIENKLKEVGYVIGQTHQYAIIYELLGSKVGQSGSLIMGLEDWVIEQYAEVFNEALKSNTRRGKYLVPSKDETEVSQVLVNLEKSPFKEIIEELQKEGYREIDLTTKKEN